MQAAADKHPSTYEEPSPVPTATNPDDSSWSGVNGAASADVASSVVITAGQLAIPGYGYSLEADAYFRNGQYGWGSAYSALSLADMGLAVVTLGISNEAMIPYRAARYSATAAARGANVVVGGGARITNITAQEAARIQNAANRVGHEITLVGSRARGTANAASDWDYVINANARVRNSVSSSLPGAGRISEGIPRNTDIFTGAVDEMLPFLRFIPE